MLGKWARRDIMEVRIWTRRMDEKEKLEKVGEQPVAKMSAHEAPTLMPKAKSAKVAKAEELAKLAEKRAMGMMPVEEEVTETSVEEKSADGGTEVVATQTETKYESADGTGMEARSASEAVGMADTDGDYTLGVAPVLPMPPKVEESTNIDKHPKISKGAGAMKVEPIDSTPLMMRVDESKAEDEDKMSPDQLIAALNDMPEKGLAMSKREHKWIKWLRGLIWIAVAVALPIGAALIVRSKTSECLANGTAAGIEEWGKRFFYTAAAVAAVNLLWGAIRWFKKWNSEKWGIFRALWKVIRGLIVRVLVFTPIVLVTLILLVPILYNHFAEEIIMQRVEIKYSGIVTSDDQEFLYGEALPCRDVCQEEFELEAGKSKYYYALIDEFKKTQVVIKGDAQTAVKVLGRKDRVWAQLAEVQEVMTYAIPAESEYDALAFAVTNTAVKPEPVEGEPVEELEPMKVKVEMAGEALVADMAVGDAENPVDNKCLRVNFDNLIDFPVRMFQMMKELKAEDSDVAKIFGELDKPAGVDKLVRHYATVCTTELKSDVDYDKLQMDLQEVVGVNLRVFNMVKNDLHVSAYVTYRPLLGKATTYFLVRAGEETELIRIRMQEKMVAL